MRTASGASQDGRARRLSLLSSETPAWLPVPIDDLDRFLGKVIRGGCGYDHPYALRRNIAYNLQHLEFLDRCVADLKLTSVLLTQTWKSVIVVGCGVVESLVHFLLVSRGYYAQTKWDRVGVLRGNPKQLGKETLKAEVHLYRPLPASVRKPMTFEAMLRRAARKKILGSDRGIYPALNRLRPLRNRVHLQAIEDLQIQIGTPFIEKT